MYVGIVLELETDTPKSRVGSVHAYESYVSLEFAQGTLLKGHLAALSCVDGSFYARVNLSDFDVCRLRSCVRPFDAVDNTAGLDEVRALGPNQISELVSPDSASGCPNFSSF